jgi:hypothetical protein
MNITPDIIFSYWIYVWFLCYYIVIVFNKNNKNKNKNNNNKHVFTEIANPTIILYAALVENIFSLLYIFLSTYNFSIFLLYVIMMLLLKVLPIYLLREAPINIKLNIFVSICIFLLYVFYVQFIRKINVINLYVDIYKSIILQENKTPFFWIYNNMFSTMKDFWNGKKHEKKRK